MDDGSCVYSVGCSIFAIDSISVTNSSCYGTNNGSASVFSIINGSGNYSYTWYDIMSGTIVGLGITATNLLGGPPGGTYYVIVTDNNWGCTDSSFLTVGQPSQIIANFTVANVSCFGGNDGFITTNVSGGVGGYVYLWTPTWATTSNINTLIAGTYTVNITDAVGCMVTNTILVTQPPPLVCNILTTPPSAVGLCDGYMNVTVAGVISS